MNKYHLLSGVLGSVGVGLLLLGVLRGELYVGVFVVFPFLVGSGVFGFCGVVLLTLALIMVMVGFITGYPPESLPFSPQPRYEKKKQTTVGGGIILLGPIPIVVGSNWKIAVFLMVCAILLCIFVYFLLCRF